jgi:hypothetical protein
MFFYVIDHLYLRICEHCISFCLHIGYNLLADRHLWFLIFLQNVAPALLIQFLREHRSEWAELDVCTDIAAALSHGSSFVSHGSSYCTSAPLLLAHSFEKQEVRHIGFLWYTWFTSFVYCHWEVFHTEIHYVRLCILQLLELLQMEGPGLFQDGNIYSKEHFLLQVCILQLTIVY